MEKFQWIIYLIFLSCKTQLWMVSCHPHVAAIDSCMSMTPGYDRPEQNTGDFPFILHVSQTDIEGGKSLNVSLLSKEPDGPQFQGFLIKAAPIEALNSAVVGKFGTIEDGIIKYISCFNIDQSGITHTDNNSKSNVTAEWVAPNYYNGDIDFIATVVDNVGTFWVGHQPCKVRLHYDNTAPASKAISDYISTSDFDYTVCGTSKSCFGYPEHCMDTQDCTMAMSFSPDMEGDKLQVDLMGVTSGYVAFGLSTNELMGDDSVIECMSSAASSTEVTVHASVNSGYDNFISINDSSYVSLISGSYKDGVLYCTFTRPVQTTVTTPESKSSSTDLNANEYHLLLASGSLTSTGDDITTHLEKCASHKSINLMSTDYIIVDSNKTVPDFDYSACGMSKSCFGYPPHCVENQQCTLFIMYSPSSDGENLEVDLMGVTSGYVAFGLSLDDQMGDDSVIECMVPHDSNGVTTHASVNSDHDNIMSNDDPVYVNFIHGNYVGGVLKCSVTRPVQTTVISSEAASCITDLNANEYYLFLALGPTTPDGNDIESHTQRIASVEPVKMMDTEFIIIDGSNKPSINIVVHGSLMTVAWIGLVSVAVFMARYYKDMWPDTLWCKLKIWFAVHRALNITAVVITMAAFILIFVYKKGFSSVWKDNPHPILGCFTMGFAIIQPFGSLFRCAPGTPNRPIFNWLHFLLGSATFIPAITTIFFAVNLKNTYLPKYFWWILVGFIIFFVIMCIIMESAIEICQSLNRNNETNSKIINGSNGISENHLLKQKNMDKALFKHIMLCIFLCGVVGFTVALVTVICTATSDS